MLISNHHQETLLLHRLLRHQEDEDKVTVVSSDGDKFRISRFVFSFFSSYFQTDSFDVVLTAISTNHLREIIETLKLTRKCGFIDAPLEDVKCEGIDPDTLSNLVHTLGVQNVNFLEYQRKCPLTGFQVDNEDLDKEMDDRLESPEIGL